MRRLFVSGSLPPLEFDSKPDINSPLLRSLFEENLSKRELKKIHVLQFWIDLSNIQNAMYKTKSFDPRGMFSEDMLKMLLKEGDGLPEYVTSFFADFTTEAERKRNFLALVAGYFQEERKKAKGFVREFLEFEHNIKILLTGFRTKRLGRDVARELQFEDSADPIVQMVLLQKNTSGSFVFPLEFRELEEKLEEAGRDPVLQYEAIMKFRFDYYSEQAWSHPFALRALAATMMRVWILEDLFALREEKGEEILNKVVELGA